MKTKERREERKSVCKYKNIFSAYYLRMDMIWCFIELEIYTEPYHAFREINVPTKFEKSICNLM